MMPHNLYLHSALVQTRRIGRTIAERREACRFNFIDSCVALNGALMVNAAILVLSAAVFFKHGMVVTEIEQAQSMLSPLMGTTAASFLFAIALLASGQSSTLTGTFAGQIVMEGFLDLRMRPWLRRLMTRSLAIIPAVITVYMAGEQGTFQLLLLSQVIISMQLPFAVIPLIRFTSDRSRMGEFANRGWVKMLAWGAAAFILALGFWLAWIQGGPWILGAAWRMLLVGPLIAGVLALLGWIMFFRVQAAPQRSNADRRRDCVRSSRSGVSPDSGAARSFRPRSRCDRSRRRDGAFAWGDAAHSACGGRRHQPVARRAIVHRGNSGRRRILSRDRGVAGE